jgi:Fe(3+) dicitrate transport protein
MAYLGIYLYHLTMLSRFTLLVFFLICVHISIAQHQIIGKIIQAENQNPLPTTTLFLKELNKTTLSNEKGEYNFSNIPTGNYTLVAYLYGKTTEQVAIQLQANTLVYTVNFQLKNLNYELEAVSVEIEREKSLGLSRLRAVDGMGIYEAKKNEVIVLKELTANLATNNPRQVYAKIAGLNIWESDGAGLQLGIGGRGLSPNRTSNFNTRQNGYDISADALGYPESYYTPPTEALERIEVVRGAASLQYGTQFGGMLNFVFRKPPTDKKISFTSRQSVGSWGFFNSFNSIAGTVAKNKLSYYAYVQRKQGDGWRPNSQFYVNTGFVSLQYALTEKLKVGVEYTNMYYLAKQAGGLTDVLFEQNPQQSIRSRNWFNVNWNLMAATATYNFSHKTQLNTRFFGLIAQRQALGNLAPINNLDFGANRDLINGTFNNIGNETRLLHRYQLGKQNHVALVGFRLYKGTTTAQQGEANAKDTPDFNFLNPNNLEKSDFVFPNYNYAVFAENIFNLSEKISVTPGIRFEHIRTYSEGYYKQRVTDAAGNVIVDNKINEAQQRIRSFVLFGLGLSYKCSENTEFYSNISQNYRAINFSDLRIDNPNARVDPNITDEQGYTADIGYRGSLENVFNFDVSAFYVAYKNRIGLLLKADQPPLFNDYRLRTNIADARNIGIEAFGELNWWKLINKTATQTRLTHFVNLAFIDARYINTEDNTIRNKQVELVPPITFRTGVSFQHKQFRSQLSWAYTAEHFTDATNARRTSSAVNGIIPTYHVADFSVSYQWRWLTVEGSCNNLLNSMYFTRRAEGYPGPGIIPADARSFYATIQVKL